MFSKNMDEVYRAFINKDWVREDHYSDCNGVYRFCAVAKYKGLNEKNINEAVLNLTKKLYKLPIIPSRIFVSDYELIEVEWAARDYQIVNDKMQYLKLSLEFAKFLDECGIDELMINSGAYNDDPEFFKDSFNTKFNTNPKFNIECFGHKNIEMQYCL
ncbi:hypothetical protein AXY43_13770 [Clostridium sp. MF28]|uniref:hypothetical protein n=1 Tax=Clostridium TaxID=1485 RepID=UPI000CF8F77E|nr:MULTISPECIES: hypothetical protein [Clostridium]AVK49003.1 hypothetical protein AXY43_13770 [Clostridium sp. MF28]PSM56384.1 hypothetical protein C4L39_17930 [Clostridium diolis]